MTILIIIKSRIKRNKSRIRKRVPNRKLKGKVPRILRLHVWASVRKTSSMCWSPLRKYKIKLTIFGNLTQNTGSSFRGIKKRGPKVICIEHYTEWLIYFMNKYLHHIFMSTTSIYDHHLHFSFGYFIYVDAFYLEMGVFSPYQPKWTPFFCRFYTLITGWPWTVTFLI